MSTTQPTESAQPQTIPTPPDFPITWEQEGDERIFWTTDRMHFPVPITPLDDSLIRILYEQGFNAASDSYGLPVLARARRFNTYHYMIFGPRPLPHEELEAMGQQSQEKIGAAMATLNQTWNEAYLPEIRKQIEQSAATDYDAASLEEFRGLLETAVERFHSQWQMHFTLAVPFLLAPSMFEDLYRDLFSDQTALTAYRLIQGLDNLTNQMGRELWALSRRAKENPTVLTAFETEATERVVSMLRTTEDGQQFLESLSQFLDRFGHRANRLGISEPTWIENPSQVIGMLKEYLTRDDYDPDVELASLAEQRERSVAEARERLASYPQPVRDQFEFFLKAAQDATVIGEDHGYWIDFRGLYETRRAFLAAGNHLVKGGSIAERDDVFYLTLDEVREALNDPAAHDLREAVAARKAEMEHFSQITPPPAVGTMPPGAPPDNPVTRALGRFFGTLPAPSTEPGVLKGAPGSAGVARGTARVIYSLDEADRLKAGDILVTTTTTPPWTPIFAAVAAVVTDTGGPLSHCAVVAREYGIPAVVGTGMATAVIRDGQEIEVDGVAGRVRLL